MSGAVSSVGDIVDNAVSAVGDVGRTIDQTVRDVVPGGWTTAALLTAGYYYSPEIGAYINGATGETVPLAQVADAGAAGGAASTGTGLTTGGGLGLTSGGGVGLTAPEAISGLSNTGMAYGTGSLIPAGSAAAGAALGGGGSTLASMLPYMAGAQVGTGLLQANAAQKAADVQSAAAQGATQLQGQIFNTINQQQAPYRTAGYQTLNTINSMLPGAYVKYDASGNPIGTGEGTGYLTHQFSPEDFAAGIDPGYAFRLQQGQMANQRAANVGGGALSGNTLAGLQAYTQGQASQEYGNAFNRYQAQRQNIFNTLSNIAGIGQSGQTQANQAATNYGSNVANLGVGSAAAQAAGLTGSTAALSNAAGNVANTYMLANLLGQRGSLT